MVGRDPHGKGDIEDIEYAVFLINLNKMIFGVKEKTVQELI